MKLPSLRPVLLALLLLLAQLGASAHALSHLQKQPDADSTVTVCQWCVAYASLDGPTPPRDASPRALEAPRLLPPPVATTRFCGVRQRLAYRSQAPPFVS